MFSAKEQEIINYGLKSGKSKEEVTQALSNFRTGVTPKKDPLPTQEPNYLQRVGNAYKGAGQDISKVVGITDAINEDRSNLSKAIDEANMARDNGDVLGAIKGFGKTTLETARVPLRTVGAIAGATFAPITEIPVIKNTVQDIMSQIMKIPGVDHILQNAVQLAEQNPALAKDIQNIVDIASLGLGGSGEKVVNEGAKTVIDASKKAVSEGVGASGNAIKNIASSGAAQITKDIVERVPRAIDRVGEIAQNAKNKAILIKNSTPEVANAIKVNLDKGIIDTVGSVDKTTAKAFRDVVNVAETPAKSGVKINPTKVGGDLASKQYDVILKEKNAIGKKLGDATKALSKDANISMQDSFKVIDDTLANSGIDITYTKKGSKLDFTGSKYTPAERTKITELYKLATEGGDSLSPLNIREKDQLFSKLQREARMEGVGNIIIDTPEGSKSLFSVFRDIYSSKLDSVSPEIKALNAKYTLLAKLTDDIESSIVKTPNFNATKSIDSAEFAKVNLRRIFGESQSSPAFEAVVDAMDKASRGLGYRGASPKAVAQFAEQVRSLYPDIVPKTGFQGGIKTSVGGALNKVAGKVMELGTPNLADQQKALRELLDSLIKKTTKK